MRVSANGLGISRPRFYHVSNNNNRARLQT